MQAERLTSFLPMGLLMEILVAHFDKILKKVVIVRLSSLQGKCKFNTKFALNLRIGKLVAHVHLLSLQLVGYP